MCSLNVSKPTKKTYNKIAAFTRGNSDIIFHCDTRLHSDKQTSALHDIEKKLFFLGYNIYHNSNSNSRGTAILISRKLKYDVTDTYKDDDGNILILKVIFNNITLTLGSIYGPNTDVDFFDRLDHHIKNFNSDFTILGGDWNTTLDPRHSDVNIDTHDTAGIPSTRRSNRLLRLCDDNELSDPFRHFYPEKREFTYVPFPMAATNRSRLDFYIISKKLLEYCTNCRIPNSLSSVNFDHKPVYLCFRRDNPYKKQCINDMILNDTDLQDVVAITVIETYINHLSPNNNVSDIDINIFKNIIGQVLVSQKILNNCKLLLAENGFCQNLTDRCTVLRETIGRLLSELPDIEFLEN